MTAYAAHTSPSAVTPTFPVAAPNAERASDATDVTTRRVLVSESFGSWTWETEDIDLDDRADLSDDPAFMESLAALRASSEAVREQLAAFREYVSASREAARHDRRMAVLSLSISLVSLCIALISLLNQLDVI